METVRAPEPRSGQSQASSPLAFTHAWSQGAQGASISGFQQTALQPVAALDTKGPQADTGAGSDNLSETTLSEHLKRSSSLPAVEPLALYPHTPAAGFVRLQPSSARADRAPPEIFKPRPRPASAADLLSLARDVGSITSQDGEVLQDEREGKRLRRKQSNRESARRSRLRKQAESESLNSRVEALQAENTQLREENGQLRERLDTLQPELGMHEAAATLQSVASGRREPWPGQAKS